MALDTLWSESFPTKPRPQVYSSHEVGKDGYLPLTDTTEFLVDSLPGLTASQLYALTANNAEALRRAQEEWTNLERIAAQIKTQDRFSTAYKDPQALPSHQVFDERKEATLYNYKYEANRPMVQSKFTLPTGTTDQEKFDLREPPNPFAQRIPNDKQYRAMMSVAKNEGREKNPDSQTPYDHNFALQIRPKGTWIAKMAPNEAVQPPRTRAREAQLNGVSAERQTRFQGEKVPPTRGFTSASEIASGEATPIGSPASRKRKIETVEIALPRKKHPNQHTKRREREEAERLAALQIQQGELMTLQGDGTTSSAATPKKKHPNQYTKRREREEAARLAAERHTRDHVAVRGSADMTVHEYFRSMVPVQDAIRNPPTEKRKHPNQYTKRREREAKEREDETIDYFDGQYGYKSLRNEATPASHAEEVSRSTTPASPKPQAPVHPSRNIDFSRMTVPELRTFTFKDWELTALLQERHLWLNDDPALAEQWKIKIENSAYAMRTYAMLKKWKEWASEGRDKRPRDKDKNRAKAANANNHAVTAKADGEEADVESMADDTANNKSTDTGNEVTSRPPSKIVTLKRPTRTRASRVPFETVESPKVMPSSPLVNGVNARDLDTINKRNNQAKNQSFTSTLQTIGEVDNATKVGRWQADTVNEPVASEAQNMASHNVNQDENQLLTTAHLLNHGNEDEIYLSTQSTRHPNKEPELELNSSQQSETIFVNDGMEVDSEDPLALPTNSPDSQSQSQSTSTSESDSTSQDNNSSTIRMRTPSNRWTDDPPYNPRYRSTDWAPPDTKPERRTMTRTRSQQTSRPVNDDLFPPPAPPPPRSTGSNRHRATRGISNRSVPTNVGFAGNGSVSPVLPNGTGTGTGTRRAGLRPNPVKRSLTSESLKMASGKDGDGNAGVRRSLRNSVVGN